jgi:hypothetical protein
MRNSQFFLGNLKGRDHLEVLGIDGRIILKLIFRVMVEGCGWINFAQDRDHWLAFVNMVMKLWLPQKMGNILTSCPLGRPMRRWDDMKMDQKQGVVQW